jgi:hypothetical protein
MVMSDFWKGFLVGSLVVIAFFGVVWVMVW